MKNELPNPFRFEDGRMVRTVEDWRLRRQELLDLILDIEYGHLPPIPERTEAELLCNHTVERMMSARHDTYRIITGPDRSFQFIMKVTWVPGEEPQPVVLSCDGCWRNASDQVVMMLLDRGYALAEFSRVEIVPDTAESAARTSGLYKVYPEGDFGALAAWAWGCHRCVDILLTLDHIDPKRIVMVGHSRGGKTALLAGATDERIALTAPNNSGCAGAGCFRFQGRASERLADITHNFPHWLGPRLKEYIGRESELPFDQHCLKALVAPRLLLTTEAMGDLWANPSGTWHTYLAAREVYRFLNVEDNIGTKYRGNEHAHGYADWEVMLDFADWHFFDEPNAPMFNNNPYTGLKDTFTWSAPR